MDVEKDNDKIPLADPSVEFVRTLYFYDKAGRLTRVEQHGQRLDAGGNPEPSKTILSTTYDYNTVGWLTGETDPLGNRTEIRYDKHGLVTRVDVREKVADSPTGEEVFTTLYKYDPLDRLESITDGLGNITSFEYDSRDAVIRQVDPLGNVTRFEYDVYGRQTTECIEMTDTGLGTGMRPPDSDVVTQYVYDANSNLIRLIDAHNTPTDQVYDALDRRVELRYVDGTATTYKYDGNDNVVWIQDNNGLIKKTKYDPLDNPLHTDINQSQLKPNIVIVGATYETFEYDALGQVTRAKNDEADINFKVDSLGRVYEESLNLTELAQTYTIKRQHDDFDFLTRLIYPNGRILVYQPDDLNRIKRIQNQSYGATYPGDTNLSPQRLILENTYRGLRIGRKLYGNGSDTLYAYDGKGRVTEIVHTSAQSTNLLTLQHLYDAADNMRFKYEYASGQQDYGEVYKYDSRYQLTHYQPIVPPNPLDLTSLAPTQVVPPDDPQFDGQAKVNNYLGNLIQIPNTFTFKYDKLGNRLEESHPGQAPILYTPNNLNQYVQRDGVLYNHNHNGNLQDEREQQSGNTIREYIHNHRNQIVNVKHNAFAAQFRFDALGRRIWSDVGSVETYFLYDDQNLIEEWQPLASLQAHQLSAQYVNELETDSRCHLAVRGSGTTQNTEYWYHKDLIGSTRLRTSVD